MKGANIKTNEFIKKNKITFLLACWAVPSGLVAYRIKKDLGIPYAVWCLGSDITIYAKIPILKTMITQALRNASIIFVNSHSLRVKVMKLTGRQPVFLPAVTEFEAETTTITFRKKKNTFYLLYIGRLESVKGIDILIKSLSLIKTSEHALVLWIGGEGSLMTTLKEQVDRMDLAGNVQFLGNLSRGKVMSYMKIADLLIVPSRNESLPLVMIEAGKMGLPSVVTDVGDSARFIQKYSAGIVTEPNSAQSLAEGISRALRYLPTLTRTAKKRKLLLRKTFTPETASKLFTNYVTKII